MKCNPRPTVTQQPPPLQEGIDRIQHLEDWEYYKRQESIHETVSVSKPTFVKPLNSLEDLIEGGNAHFEAQVTPVNDPTMRVEWYLNGYPLISGTKLIPNLRSQFNHDLIIIK